jgi:hypothetical protein
MKLHIQKTNKMSNKKLVMESSFKEKTDNINQSTLGSSIVINLFLTFLTLKLTDNVSWSWWWITSPLWLPTGLSLITIVLTRLTSFLEQNRK